MNRKKRCVLSAFFAAAMWCTACGGEKPVAAAPPSAPAGPAVVPAPVAAEEMLSVSVPLVVEQQVEVMAQRDGVVVNISADAGVRVRAGTVLATLDSRQLSANLEASRAKTRSIQADLKNWEAEAKVLQSDYVRAQRMWDEKLIAQEQLEHAKYKAESDQWDILRVREQLNTAKEEEHSLELELEKTRIAAPFDGLVARRYVRAGQTVAKGERLFWVTAEAPLLLRFTLPEKFVGHLQKGQMLAISSPDVPDEKHNAKIKEVSPVVDPSSGTIEVLAELVGERGNLRPGMTANVRIPSPK